MSQGRFSGLTNVPWNSPSRVRGGWSGRLENLDQSQKSESAGSNSRYRRDLLGRSGVIPVLVSCCLA